MGSVVLTELRYFLASSPGQVRRPGSKAEHQLAGTVGCLSGPRSFPKVGLGQAHSGAD